MNETQTHHNTWTLRGEAEAGNRGTPGDQYHVCEVRLYQHATKERWRCEVYEHWGSNQGYLQANGSHATEGRGDTPEDAAAACREDALAWAEGDPIWEAALNSTIRQAVYDVEDSLEEPDNA